ncbi:hypothetical protein SAMN02745146_1889 [Hymenobacter daecheongensis DSM 21074]|uniref:PorV/PorQ family protein n=1 Tax=Hymenobacter daecheongensis DSM 21074 TaxID=1121955 RepID=A0A1M6F0H3_9BACT|nr:PorV/PorQ family protein [Hymenobacter daecheongensis]SHI91146.1 hypothetical protein SAMN02745146_1889 [Hymenobacter daecheongensis DSM 21074]
MPHVSRLIFLLAGTGFTLGLAPRATAQTRDLTPKYSNEFLNIGVGGRALGMANVQVGLVGDATSGYWNPAGLLNQKHKYDAVLMHSELFSGIVKNDYAAFSMPLDEQSALGASLIRTGVDNIADTRNLINEYGYIQYDRIQYFSVADYAVLLSYARRIGSIEGLKVGANGKIIYRNYGRFANAWGFGIDAGAQYDKGDWHLGLTARDITTTFNAWSINADEFKDVAAVGDKVPTNSTEITLPRFVLGVGRSFKLPGQLTALVATDLEITTDGQRNTLVSSKAASIDPKAGVELGFRDLVFLRGGIGNFQKMEAAKSFDNKGGWRGQPTLGVGVALSGLRLDMALSRLALDKQGGGNANSIIVSLGYGIK